MNNSKTGYILVDIAKLRTDVENSFKIGKANNPEGLQSYAALMENNGLCRSTFSNAKRNYIRNDNKAGFDLRYATDNLKTYTVGAMQKVVYLSLLNTFRLDDTYKIPLRADMVKEADKPKTDNNEDKILAKLDEILTALNRLAEIQEQRSTPVKPVAVLRS